MASLTSGSYNNIWTKNEGSGKNKWSTGDKVKVNSNSSKSQQMMRKDRVGKKSKPLATFQKHNNTKERAKKKIYGGDKVRCKNESLSIQITRAKTKFQQC